MSNWQLAVGSARICNPTSAQYTSTEATHGSNVLEIGGGTTIKQLTNIDLLPNRQYTLNVDVGNRADVADANMFFIIELYAGSQFIGAIHQNNLATVNGGFVTGTATYTSPANVAAQQKLEIRISAAATLVNFDNVRLSSTVVEEQYAYDSNGNRLSTTGARQSALGSHNRLQTDGTYNYVYDNEGNIIRRTQISDGSVLEYQWDHRNRLTKISTKAAGATASSRDIFYYYDAFDRRVGKTIDYEGNGVIDRSWVYVFDGQNTVMVLQDADGAASMQGYRISERILQGPAVDMVMSEETYSGATGPLVGSSIASSNSGTTLWTIGDDQGSIQDAVDNNGVVRRRVSYNAFGQRTNQIDTDANGQILPGGSPSALDTSFGYTGRDWDSDAQLQNNRARWYDPTTARWLSQDPIGFAGGDANLYRYTGNSPTNRTDPSGLDWLDEVAGFGAGIGDSMSFGISWVIRDKMIVMKGVDYNGGGYYWGGVAVDVGTCGLTAIPKAGGKAVIKTAAKEDGEALARELAERVAREAAEAASKAAAESAARNQAKSGSKGLLDWWKRGSEIDDYWRSLSLMDKIMYEIGEKTLASAKYAEYANLDRVSRGRKIIEDSGWFRAVCPEGTGWRLGAGTTLGTGPTPSVR